MPSLLDASSFILWQAATSATPLILAGYGELVAQRAGVINVGIEGVMLMGAACAYGAAILTGSSWLGLLAAAGIGILFAALFALVSIWCRADQVVAGTAINILAAGASATLSAILRTRPDYEQLQRAFNLHNWQRVSVNWLSGIPAIGDALAKIANQYLMTYVVLAAGVALWALLKFTRLGLIIQALGDAPDACDAAGIRVRMWRTACVLFAGACAGIAGSFLSIMALHDFNNNMTDGRGFLVLALVIFCRWKLPNLLLGTMMFGAIDGVQVYLAGIPRATQIVPHALFGALPYVATLVALAILTRSAAGPAYLGRPWPEE